MLLKNEEKEGGKEQEGVEERGRIGGERTEPIRQIYRCHGIQSPEIPTSWPPTIFKYPITVVKSSGNYSFLARNPQSHGP